jgi:hypothetical protein
MKTGRLSDGPSRKDDENRQTPRRLAVLVVSIVAEMPTSWGFEIQQAARV